MGTGVSSPRPWSACLTSVRSLARSSWHEERRLLAKQDLAAEDVADDPEHLVTDIGLKAIDGQDHSARLTDDASQSGRVGQRQGEQLVVAVQEAGDAAHADGHAATDQLGVDLGDAAVLDVAEAADEGDDIETELLLRQGDGPLAFGAE